MGSYGGGSYSPSQYVPPAWLFPPKVDLSPSAESYRLLPNGEGGETVRNGAFLPPRMPNRPPDAPWTAAAANSPAAFSTLRRRIPAAAASVVEQSHWTFPTQPAPPAAFSAANHDLSPAKWNAKEEAAEEPPVSLEQTHATSSQTVHSVQNVPARTEMDQGQSAGGEANWTKHPAAMRGRRETRPPHAALSVYPAAHAPSPLSLAYESRAPSPQSEGGRYEQRRRRSLSSGCSGRLCEGGPVIGPVPANPGKGVENLSVNCYPVSYG